jgi:undecaprenyl-diphosphatase
MTTLDAIVVGVVQGLTEFLPVSSSGHLVITRYFYGVHDLSLSYSIMLHGGTLLAVIVALWREILDCAKLLLSGTRTGVTILLALVIATIPGALFGYLFAAKLDTIFVEKGVIWHGLQLEPYKFVGAAMLVTAQAFLHRANEMLRLHGDAVEHGPWYDAITLRRALWIGLAQAAAVVPGLSRSGATIAAGIMAGLSRATAARFSFLMAIPIVLGAVVHDLIDHRVELMYESSADVHVKLLGVAVAAVTGFIAVRFMLRWLRTHDLHDFVVYLWIVGLICIAS